jgi:hypothetical protein
MRLAVLARAIPAFVVALLVAFAPLANDLCARSCETPVEQACPAHSPAPAQRCAHNHVAMNADLPRPPSAFASSNRPVAILVSVIVTVPIASAEIPRSHFLHSPPRPAVPLLALRI